MTSLMTRSVVLFLCWVSMSMCRAEDFPISFMDYLSAVNGHFNNYDENQVGSLDRIEVKGRPVLIPGFMKEPVVYFQEVINGNLFRLAVFVRNESSTDQRLYITYYNFSDPSKYTPETFSTDDLSNLTRDDFRIDEGCPMTFVKVSPGALFGEANDCRNVVNGRHPVYTFGISCNYYRFEPPMAAYEITALESYDLQHKGPRYPLVGAPEGYVDPCQGGR